MLTSEDLHKLAKNRFNEALVLKDNQMSDGAIYLVGYALELILKRHIVLTLNWDGYPEKPREFDSLKSFKVHNLQVLLHLAGLEKKVKSDTEIYAKWQMASTWSTEVRYKSTSTLTDSEVADIIEATRDILNFILKS